MSEWEIQRWRSPMLVGVLSLGLMVAGWMVSTYRPPSDEARRLDDLAAKAEAFERENTDPGQAGLAQRLEVYTRPPYQLLGRVMVYAGGMLFLVAGVAMWFSRPRPVPEEEEAESEIDADLRGE